MFFLQGAALLAAVTLITFIPLRHVIDFLCGKDYYNAHSWPKGLCLLVAGVFVWVIGRHYNRASRQSRFAPVRTFLFIRMEYWGVAFAVVAVFLILLG